MISSVRPVYGGVYPGALAPDSATAPLISAQDPAPVGHVVNPNDAPDADDLHDVNESHPDRDALAMPVTEGGDFSDDLSAIARSHREMQEAIRALTLIEKQASEASAGRAAGAAHWTSPVSVPQQSVDAHEADTADIKGHDRPNDSFSESVRAGVNRRTCSSPYPRWLSTLVLGTHAVSLCAQVSMVAAPHVMPDVFAWLEGRTVCERGPSGAGCVERSARCKVLRIGNAVFTPGMLIAPYFALLALGDLACWSVEICRPGSLRFQGDSIANLIGWLDRRGVFDWVQRALGPSSDDSHGAVTVTRKKRSLPARLAAGAVDKLRGALKGHGDLTWQKAVATRIRHLSASIFIAMAARLPFSDDTSSLPSGLPGFFDWLEKAGAATKLAAASAESLVKPGVAGDPYAPDGDDGAKSASRENLAEGERCDIAVPIS